MARSLKDIHFIGHKGPSKISLAARGRPGLCVAFITISQRGSRERRRRMILVPSNADPHTLTMFFQNTWHHCRRPPRGHASLDHKVAKDTLMYVCKTVSLLFYLPKYHQSGILGYIDLI